MAKGQDDLNRFLAEIDRLRKKSDGGGSSPPPPKAKAVPVAKPVAKPAPQKRQQPKEPPVVPVVPPPSVPVYAPAQPLGLTTKDVAKIRTIEAPVSVASVDRPQQISEPAQVQRRRTVHAPRSIAALLASKESLAAAMALQFVLGPPKCRQS